jgi:hypothetical protein
LPEGVFQIEVIIDPSGGIVAADLIEATPEIPANARKALLDEVRSRHYERTTVFGVGAYVCLPMQIRTGFR